MTSLAITIDGERIPVRPSDQHEYVLETRLVAQGYGVNRRVIQEHKKEHADELVEGKHWVVGKTDTLGGQQNATLWTKRGIIRLGFFIRSARAKRFRDAAEDLIVRAGEQPQGGELADMFEHAARILRAGRSQAEAFNLIAPALPYGLVSKRTGRHRNRLVRSYYTSRFAPDENTIRFLASHGMQLDFYPVLVPLGQRLGEGAA